MTILPKKVGGGINWKSDGKYLEARRRPRKPRHFLLSDPLLHPSTPKKKKIRAFTLVRLGQVCRSWMVWPHHDIQVHMYAVAIPAMTELASSGP